MIKTKKPSALQTMKKELARLQAAMSECVDDAGIEYPWMKYRHQILIRKAKEFKAGIDWLEAQEIGKTNAL